MLLAELLLLPTLRTLCCIYCRPSGMHAEPRQDLLWCQIPLYKAACLSLFTELIVSITSGDLVHTYQQTTLRNHQEGRSSLEEERLCRSTAIIHSTILNVNECRQQTTPTTRDLRLYRLSKLRSFLFRTLQLTYPSFPTVATPAKKMDLVMKNFVRAAASMYLL